MKDLQWELSEPRWNEFVENVLRTVAQSFNEYPGNFFSGEQVAKILNATADGNPTRFPDHEEGP